MTDIAKPRPIMTRHHVANVVRAPSSVSSVTLKKSTNAAPTPVRNVVIVDTIAPTVASITIAYLLLLFIGIGAREPPLRKIVSTEFDRYFRADGYEPFLDVFDQLSPFAPVGQCIAEVGRQIPLFVSLDISEDVFLAVERRQLFALCVDPLFVADRPSNGGGSCGVPGAGVEAGLLEKKCLTQITVR